MLWLYLDAEVLVLPPVLSSGLCFVGCRSSSTANLIYAIWLHTDLSIDDLDLDLDRNGIEIKDGNITSHPDKGWTQSVPSNVSVRRYMIGGWLDG